MARGKKKNNDHLAPKPAARPLTRLRSPDWRYEYARKLVDDNREPRPEDDKWVRELYSYLRVVKVEPADVVESYRDQHPDMADAMVMFVNSTMYRMDVEARVMAKYTLKEVADIIGRPESVVEMYVNCFFDVVDQLENYGYLHRWVLQPVLRVAPFSGEALWKRAAMFGGRKMLEELEKCTPHELQQLYETLFDNLLLTKGIQAANGIEPGHSNAIEIMSLARENISDRRKLQAFTKANQDSSDRVQNLTSAMLKSFAFSVMTDGMVPADPLRLGVSPDDQPRFVDVTASPMLGKEDQK